MDDEIPQEEQQKAGGDTVGKVAASHDHRRGEEPRQRGSQGALAERSYQRGEAEPVDPDVHHHEHCQRHHVEGEPLSEANLDFLDQWRTSAAISSPTIRVPLPTRSPVLPHDVAPHIRRATTSRHTLLHRPRWRLLAAALRRPGPPQIEDLQFRMLHRLPVDPAASHESQRPPASPHG